MNDIYCIRFHRNRTDFSKNIVFGYLDTFKIYTPLLLEDSIFLSNGSHEGDRNFISRDMFLYSIDDECIDRSLINNDLPKNNFIVFSEFSLCFNQKQYCYQNQSECVRLIKDVKHQNTSIFNSLGLSDFAMIHISDSLISIFNEIDSITQCVVKNMKSDETSIDQNLSVYTIIGITEIDNFGDFSDDIVSVLLRIRLKKILTNTHKKELVKKIYSLLQSSISAQPNIYFSGGNYSMTIRMTGSQRELLSSLINKKNGLINPNCDINKEYFFNTETYWEIIVDESEKQIR